MDHEKEFKIVEPLPSPGPSGYLGHGLKSYDKKPIPDGDYTAVAAYGAQQTFRPTSRSYSSPYKFTITLSGEKLENYAGKDARIAITPQKTVTATFPKTFSLKTDTFTPTQILPDNLQKTIIIEEFHTGSHTIQDEVDLELSFTNEKIPGLAGKTPILNEKKDPGDLITGIKTATLSSEPAITKTLKRHNQIDLGDVSKKLSNSTLSFKSATTSKHGGTSITFNIFISDGKNPDPKENAHLLTPAEGITILRNPKIGHTLTKGYTYSFTTQRNNPGSREDFASIPVHSEYGSSLVSGFLLLRHDANMGDGPAEVRITLQYVSIARN